ncbi:MAG TPA: DUF835 domain-containing protein [Thermoplasmata archaeon]|nr:DUF835 domain-containing protein [Thermoplasmata archaeon]
MIDATWLVSVAAGAICFAAGMLGWMKNPKSKAAMLFMFAMIFVFIALAIGTLFRYIGEENRGMADSIAKVHVTAYILAQTFLWELAIVFPVDRDIRLRPPNIAGTVMVAAALVAIALGAFGGVDYDDEGVAILDALSLQIMFSASAVMIILATTLVILSKSKATEGQWDSGARYLIGLWVFVIGGIPYAIDIITDASIGIVHELARITLMMGVAVSGIIFAYSIAKGEMVMFAPPRTEAMVSSSKASYRLLHRHVYLVEEEKPDFSFKMFADILKGRCFDCENDDSFPCESLECGTCRLPCPCRTCTKYKSRAQGLIVTRQYPHEVRSKFFIQTTPILWLSTVAGKENMDPAKMSLLTDYLINFMEKSHNGVVLVDGIEYLVTSNDFPKVAKSLDRWAETAMTSDCRLVITVDPRAFSDRELALLEKNKEVVRPSADDGLDTVVR